MSAEFQHTQKPIRSHIRFSIRHHIGHRAARVGTRNFPSKFAAHIICLFIILHSLLRYHIIY
jgi:hypothetical protein